MVRNAYQLPVCLVGAPHHCGNCRGKNLLKQSLHHCSGVHTQRMSDACHRGSFPSLQL